MYYYKIITTKENLEMGVISVLTLLSSVHMNKFIRKFKKKTMDFLSMIFNHQVRGNFKGISSR